MPAAENSLNNLPEDSVSLKALLCAVIAERDRERRRAEEQEAFAQEKSALAAQQSRRIAELAQRADELYIEKLRLQMELARYRKWTYGPRADRLSEGELLQALLDFGEEPQLYFTQLLLNLPPLLRQLPHRQLREPHGPLDAWLPDQWKRAQAARSTALGFPAPPTMP